MSLVPKPLPPELRLSPEERLQLTEIFQAIREKKGGNNQGVERLKQYVATQSQEMKGEYFAIFMEAVNARIKDLIKSPEDLEGGILAVEKLLSIDHETNDSYVNLQWKNILQSALANAKHQGPHVIKSAASALGQFAANNPGPLTKKLISFEFQNALEGLQKNNPVLKQVGVIVLGQLIHQVPSLIDLLDVESFLEVMWGPLQDSNIAIRTGCAQVLKGSLRFIADRSENSNKAYQNTYSSAVTNLTSKNEFLIHGSLLVISELLDNTSTFLKPSFLPLCQSIFSLKDSKSVLIKKTMLQMVPQLIQYETEPFVRHFWPEANAFLIDGMKRDRSTFISIGKVAGVLRDWQLPIFPMSFDLLCNAVMNRSKKLQLTSEIFQSLSLFVRVFGHSSYVKDQFKKLLSVLLVSDFDQALVDCLLAAAVGIPSIAPLVESYLMGAMSYLLTASDLPTDARPIKWEDQNPFVIFKNAPGTLTEAQIPALLTALNTLANHDFRFCDSRLVTQYVSLHYLTNDNLTVRKEAASACSRQLVKKSPQCAFSAQLTTQILEKLFHVAIADTDHDIRKQVLQTLNGSIDRFLAQPEFLQFLFLLFLDESYEIQEISLQILRRVVDLNPGYVYPPLRSHIIDFVKTLKHTENLQQRENDIKLLGLIAKSFPKLVKPYAKSLIPSLMTELKQPDKGSTMLSAYCITAIGHLSLDASQEILPLLDDVVPVVIENFEDQNSSFKRSVALHTLIQLIVCTGYAVDPVSKHPRLFDIVLQKISRYGSSVVRAQLMTLLGTIGAIDPYRYKVLQLDLLESENERKKRQEQLEKKGSALRIREKDSFFKEMLRSMTLASDDYYPTIVLELLMRILENPYGELANLQLEVVQDIMTIFRSMGLRSVHYLKHFMPPLITVMEACGPNTPGLRELVFQQLGVLVGILKHYTREYLDVLIKLMEDHWENHLLLDKIVSLLENISIVLRDEFQPCLTRFLPRLLKGMPRGIRAYSRGKAFVVFGMALDPHLHLVLPAMVDLLAPQGADQQVAITAMETLSSMSHTHDLTPFSLAIFRKLVAVLNTNTNLANCVLSTASHLLVSAKNNRMKVDVFITMFQQVVAKRQIYNLEFKETIISLQNNITPELKRPDAPNSLRLDDTGAGQFKSHQIHSERLIAVWDTTRVYTKPDWVEWISKISLTLLLESPSTALRCLGGLANNYAPVATEMFNVAFLSCWDFLKPEEQKQISAHIANALSSATITTKVLHRLLDLAEYMERSEKALPLDRENLGHLAQKFRAFAKALYYIERNFRTNQQKTLKSLITINDHLGLHEAGQGLLNLAEKQGVKTEVPISWYEKLQKWSEVLQVYDVLQESNPTDTEIMLDRMRCLSHLGQWSKLESLATQEYLLVANRLAHRHSPSASVTSEIASYSLKALLNLGKFGQLTQQIPLLTVNPSEGSFYQAISCIHNQQYVQAEEFVIKSRQDLVSELATLLRESYSRAYDVVIRLQQLSELEEMMRYKQESDPARQQVMKNLWNRRLKHVRRDIDTWESIIVVRSLVISPQEDPSVWVKFANLVRKQGRFQQAKEVLINLLDKDEPSRLTLADSSQSSVIPPTIDPVIHYALLKLLWSQKASRGLAVHQLEQWISQFPTLKVSSHQQAQCYTKQAAWQLELNDPVLDVASIPAMTESCALAIQHDENWYKAWHTYAIVHYRILTYYLKQPDHTKTEAHLLPSVEGFIKSISLAPRENLQDTLRLLTLWFTHGNHRNIEKAVREGFDVINIDTWLSVIPQIIARIHISHIRNGIDLLLTRLAKKHPQALVFPLVVSYKDPIRTRVSAAITIMNNMKQHSANLIQEAMLIGAELIRVSILWKEKWCKGLEEASHLYYVEKKISKMLNILIPLHEMVSAGAQTQNEQVFVKAFGRELEKASDFCKDYMKTRNEASLNLAWDVYTHIFRQIKRQLQTDFDKLPLSKISLELEKVKDLALAVPGTYLKTYKAGKPVVGIKSFIPMLKVIQSKQQPRKLIIAGSDGSEYPFLLKGHEDLRQDERVMQLFGLVNDLLEADQATAKKHLSIQRYAAIPLSPESGLIEWLPNSDTLHELLKYYRHTHSIPLDAELTFMQRLCTKDEYYKLPILGKLEVFEYALNKTTGDDLERILWLHSSSSEIWLDKRTTYTDSLAVMSMVGYILGLGDRHPNNLMLNRNSGKIIHIDFGDCFEVAMLREKFAEKVPFRLTRMLINAMDVAGTEGPFRYTCEAVMGVLRENRESIMAVLEAFVYDPLINWKITTTDVGSKDEGDHFESGGQNLKALTVLERVSAKLTGAGFPQKGKLEIAEQVDVLIEQARSYHTLCQAFLGWCPYW